MIAWFAPLPIAFAIYLLGDRGPMRVLWHDRTRVLIEAGGLAWSSDGVAWTRLGWQDIGGVSGSGEGKLEGTTVFDRHGSEVARFEGSFRWANRRGWTELGWAVADALRLVYERVGGTGSTYRGCVLRMAGAPIGDLQRSAI
jgi:hypothetical protein